MIGLFLKAVIVGITGIVVTRIVNKQLDQVERGEMPTLSGNTKPPKR